MSKSLSQIFLPVLGGTALAVGLAYGFASREYGADRIDALEDRIASITAAVSETEQKALSEAGRADGLALEVEDLRKELAERENTKLNLTAAAPRRAESYGIGRPAHPQELAAWDVDVLPDGRGLPKGAGDVLTGEEVFFEKCASCHGDFAEGVDNWPVLAGGFDTLADQNPVKTIGSYWPFLSTAWDYISRSMPFGEAGTLTADETYAIVAYLLYSNDLVDEEFELSDANFQTVNMYNMNGFVIDDRPDQEYPKWRAEPCMENCKEKVEITMRSVFLVDTPPEGGSESIVNEATIDGLPSFTVEGPSQISAANNDTAEEAAVVEESSIAPESENDAVADLASAGENVFKKCKSCHQVGQGAKNRTGPHLNGIFGRQIGAVDGFKYSPAFKTLYESGQVWDDASMAAFLAKPKGFIKGTKMSFAGLKKAEDIEAISAYLKSLEY